MGRECEDDCDRECDHSCRVHASVQVGCMLRACCSALSSCEHPEVCHAQATFPIDTVSSPDLCCLQLSFLPTPRLVYTFCLSCSLISLVADLPVADGHVVCTVITIPRRLSSLPVFPQLDSLVNFSPNPPSSPTSPLLASISSFAPAQSRTTTTVSPICAHLSSSAACHLRPPFRPPSRLGCRGRGTVFIKRQARSGGAKLRIWRGPSCNLVGIEIMKSKQDPLKGGPAG